jgi:hypothetical protein
MILKAAALLVAFAVGVLAAPLATDARQSGKVYKIGYLGSDPPSPEFLRICPNALLRGLRKTAGALCLTSLQSLLVQADEVIQ